MIKISATTAMMLYLGMTLGIVLIIWVFQHIQKRKKKISLIEQSLYTCEYCTFTYLEDASKKVNKCPSCGSYNENNSFRPSQKS
jgi:predicted Zn-ribbon and HTH transcriptional regulator